MKDVQIEPTAVISKEARIGEGTVIWNFVQIRENAEIGKNCILANSVYIDKNVKIGNNVTIHNKSSIYRNVIIEDNVFIGPHVCFLNDKFPRSGIIRDLKGSRIVKKGASIGANSVVMADVNIGEFALVGAGSVVTKNVPSHALVYGNPAELKGFVCECGRELEKIEEKNDSIIMLCPLCNKKTEIPKEIFKLIK